MAVLDLQPVLPELSSAAGRYDVPQDARLRLSPVRQGVLTDVLVAASAGLAVLATGVAVAPAVVLLSIVLFWRIYSFAALPAYERARSFTPVVRFVQVLGAIAVIAVVVGAAAEPLVQRGSIVLVTVAVVAEASTALHRYALRRTSAVLIGNDAQVRQLEQRWSDRRDVDVVATYRWASAVDLSEHRSAVAADVVAAVARAGATSVVLAGGSSLSSPAVSHLVRVLRGAQIECLVVADLDGHAEAMRPRRIGDQVALALSAPTDRLASDLVKSSIDRVGAALGLVLLSPVLLVIALAVRWDSHGPAVFTQVRTGRDGQPFRMYKFRSMVIDAESRLDDLLDHNEGAGPLFKMAQDPRVTRLGRFLRTSSLDELLQLINVVKGEMSLVGPRPALPSETASYDPWTWRRLYVRPGLTGLWQVSGRSTLSWEETVSKDLEYVNNQSLRLDLSILLRTVGAVLRREGAH